MSISTYIAAVQAEAARGNATEHTFRPALKTLFESLAPGIAATNEPRRIACGAPDFQITRGQLPVGHVEAKDLHVDLDRELRSPQMARYLKALPNLILTNSLEFRWFVSGEQRDATRIARRDRHGKIIREPQGEMDLQRLLSGFLAQQPPVVGTPRELALRLAEMTRLLRGLIAETFKREGERGELHEQYDAFKAALIPGLDTAEFADMYAQTLTYGLFAARVAQPHASDFSRYSAARLLPRTNPLLSKLFYEIAGPHLDDRIAWAVDDIAALLQRASMDEILRDFGKRTRQEDPVVHFYETFLAAYDPKLRESRGVYYTPEPVVSFIVRAVDYLLRTRFGKPLGLADQDTLILDPATGTATFMYFVIERIYEILQQHGLAAGWNSYVGDGDKSLLRRLFGFELLMAPYAVAHLKLGLQLKEKGYDFRSYERLGVYLTNALDEGIPKQTAMPFARYIAEESQAAAEVKSSKPIMVVLGNPPYSGHSENKSEFIRKLINDYMRVDGAPLGERNPKWLQDDYVKFIRFGQWRIGQTGEGVLAYISNNGYLDNPTFRGMRQSLMQSFDDIYILNLHGNANKKERAPDGGPDENAFDIRQGVAIALFVKRRGVSKAEAAIHYADMWGEREGKYAALAEQDIASIAWQQLAPSKPFYLFVPQDVDLRDEYEQGWKVTEIFGSGNPKADGGDKYGLGICTHNDLLFVGWTSKELYDRVSTLANEAVTDAEVIDNLPVSDSPYWNTSRERKKVRESNWQEKIWPIYYRPFDWRFIYYEPDLMEIGRGGASRRVMPHAHQARLSLMCSRGYEVDKFEHVLVSDRVAVHHAATRKEGNYLFPLYLYPSTNGTQRQVSLFDEPEAASGSSGRRANLSPEFIKELTDKIGMQWLPDGRGDLQQTVGPEDVFHYAYAVFHSPTYRARYAELLKIDFPRLPLTSDAELFRDLAQLGAELVDLHLLRLPGAVPPDAVGGNGGAAALVSLRTSFPVSGSNMVEKPHYDEAQQRVSINKQQYFEGVDAATWRFRIGGYQVLDKWLKDRKGRALSFNDLLHYQRVVVALAETQRRMAAIDARIGAWPIR